MFMTIIDVKWKKEHLYVTLYTFKLSKITSDSSECETHHQHPQENHWHRFSRIRLPATSDCCRTPDSLPLTILFTSWCPNFVLHVRKSRQGKILFLLISSSRHMPAKKNSRKWWCKCYSISSIFSCSCSYHHHSIMMMMMIKILLAVKTQVRTWLVCDAQREFHYRFGGRHVSSYWWWWEGVEEYPQSRENLYTLADTRSRELFGVMWRI